MEGVHECFLDEFNAREAINLLPVMVYLGIILVFGIFGNGLSFFIYSSKFRQSNSRSFFIFLSVMELISCVLIVPMEIFTLTHHFELEYGNLKCRAVMFISIWQVHVSSTTLIVIALDRWRKICHPFGWQISLKLSKVLLISLIVVGFVVALPSISVYSSNPYTLTNVSEDTACAYGNGTDVLTDITIYKCSTNNELESIFPQLYVMFFWIMVLVGVGILSFLYWDIKQAVKRQENKFGGEIGPTPDKRKRFVLQDSVEVENFERNTMLSKGKNESLKITSEIGEQINATENNEDKYYYKDDNCDMPNENDHDSDKHIDSDEQLHDNDETSSIDNISRHDICIDEFDENNLNIKSRYKSSRPLDVGVSGKDCETNNDLISKCDVNSESKHAQESHVNLKNFRCVVRSLGNRMVCTVLSKKTSQKDARSRNVTFIMFVVTVSSVLGFLPYLTLSSMRALYHNFEQNMSTSQYAVYNVFLRSYFLKAITNPIVYGLLDPRFRASVKSLCSKTDMEKTTDA